MIPQIFHTVWVQGHPLPDTHKQWFESWRKHNPKWTHVVWGESDYLPFLENREVYDTAVNHAQRAEIAQKEILWKYGGVYLDADFECFRPVGHFFEEDRVVTWDESPGQLGNQIYGTPPLHQAVREAIDDIPRSIRYQRMNGLPQPYGAGPHLIQRLWRDREDVLIRPSWEFFPYLWNQPKPSDFGEAYGAHHWTASWK